MSALSARRVAARRHLAPSVLLIAMAVVGVLIWRYWSSWVPTHATHKNYSHSPAGDKYNCGPYGAYDPMTYSNTYTCIDVSPHDTFFQDAYVAPAVKAVLLILAWLGGTAGGSFIGRIIGSEVFVALSALIAPPAGWRAGNRIASGLALSAALLVGRRHVHLREAWLADVRDDAGKPGLSRPRGLVLGLGYLRAAIVVRSRDATDIALKPVDRLLATSKRAHAVTTIVTVVMTDYEFTRHGLDGVIGNAEGLAVVTGVVASAAAFYRKRRGLDRKP